MKEQDSIMKMFNLPKYIKGKTFAEASKAIADKYEGLNDKDSQAELNELQERLKQAQEHVKAQSQPAPAPTPVNENKMGGKMNYDSNDYFLGGIMSMLGGAGAGQAAAGAAGAAGGGGLGGLLGGEGGGIPGLGALSKAPEAINHFKEGNAAKGFMSAASGVASAIPGVGSAVAPILDIAGSFIGNGKAKKEADEKEREGTYAQTFGGGRNRYDTGGFMSNIDPNALIGMLNPELPNISDQFQTDYNRDTAGIDVDGIRAKNEKFAEMGLDEASLDAMEQEDMMDELEKFTEGYTPGQEFADEAARTPGIAPEEYETDDIKRSPLEALRYAPAATDLYQLLSQKKPEKTVRGRLGNKYQEQLVDERELVKGVQESIGSQRGAITEASGGSQAAQRANLLGLSLQGTKAISDAMVKAGAQNRGEKKFGQQFNLGVDQTNLQQSNAERLADEQNQGAYETQKSQLISQLGSNLGEIGKEQLFKKYPELMGMDFDAMGKYLRKKKK